MPKVLRCSVSLVVEGDDDENFIKAMLKHLGVNDLDTHNLRGKDNLTNVLAALKNTAGFEKVAALGIVRDAELDRRAVFQSIGDALEKNNLPRPHAIGQFAQAENLHVGVHIMPGDSTAGMLEDLCLRTVGNHPVMPLVEELFSGFSRVLKKRTPPDAPLIRGEFYYPKNESKAKALAFLSGMHETYSKVGIAALNGCWDFDHEALTDLRVFLGQLRALA